MLEVYLTSNCYIWYRSIWTREKNYCGMQALVIGKYIYIYIYRLVFSKHALASTVKISYYDF